MLWVPVWPHHMQTYSWGSWNMSSCEFLLTQDIKPQVWWSFIDDIFAIWTHGEQSLIYILNSGVRAT